MLLGLQDRSWHDWSCVNHTRFYKNLRPESQTISMNSVPDEHQYDIMLGLKNLCVKYSNKIIMGHLDVKSIKNKFELLSSLIGDNIDILMMSETKREAVAQTCSPKKKVFLEISQNS